jgi:hypothetical protein
MYVYINNNENTNNNSIFIKISVNYIDNIIVVYLSLTLR